MRAVARRRRPWRRAWPFAACALAAVACAPAAAEWEGRIEERDGALYVHNPDRPLWPDAETPRLELELEQVFGADEQPADAILAEVRDVAVDPDGNVYVLDFDDSQIVAFESSGRVRWRGGRRGEGPGELLRPLGIAADGEGRLWLLDKAGAELEWWSTDGSYLGAFLLTETAITRAGGLRFVAPRTLALLSGTDVLLLESGEPWSEYGRFETSPGMLRMGAGGVAGETGASGGRVTTGAILDYEVQIYGEDGRLERTIARPGTGFLPAAANDESGAVAFMGRAHPPHRLPAGRWLVEASWPTNIGDPEAWLARAMAGERPPERELRTVLDLFDADGRWLTGRTWDHPDSPEHGRLHLVGPDGRLYSIRTDPYPQVRRYRIAIEPPEA